VKPEGHPDIHAFVPTPQQALWRCIQLGLELVSYAAAKLRHMSKKMVNGAGKRNETFGVAETAQWLAEQAANGAASAALAGTAKLVKDKIEKAKKQPQDKK